MIKILLHGFYDPIPDLSPRTVSALALQARADTVYSGWDQGWDQKTRVIIYMSLKILAETAKVSTRAREIDILFLKEMSNNENCPEFNGGNTQICRDQGHSPKFKSKAMYMPSTDMRPSDPDTDDRGQDYVVFTADLQLYREAVNILWTVW